MNQHIERLDKSIIWLVAGLAGAMFILSYSGLRDLAARNGIDGWLSYLWPLALDAGVVIFSLSLLRNALSGDSTTFSWTMIFTLDACSVAYNVIHAQPGTDGSAMLARTMAAFPPLVLLVALRALEMQLESKLRRETELQEAQPGAIDAIADATPAVADPQPATVTQDASRNETQPATETEIAPLAGASTTERRAMVAQFMEDGKSNTEIARMFDVAPSTIGRDVKVLNGKAQ